MDGKQVRQQLAKMLDGHEAHADLSKALEDFPPQLRGVVPQGMPYSGWQLLEHMRLALWDILEFSRNARHKSPPWPDGYWPRTVAPPDDSDWDKSVKWLMQDIEEFRRLVTDPSRDLLQPIPHGKGQTILREILLAIDHTAYHTGQLVLVRKVLGVWPG